MKRGLLVAASAALAILAACSGDTPLDTDCCRLLKRVDMTPDVSTIRVGETVSFTAVAYDEDNQPVTTDVTWQVATSARGAVTSAGVFRGSSAGTTWVRGIVGNLRDSSLVTITP